MCPDFLKCVQICVFDEYRNLRKSRRTEMLRVSVTAQNFQAHGGRNLQRESQAWSLIVGLFTYHPTIGIRSWRGGFWIWIFIKGVSFSIAVGAMNGIHGWVFRGKKPLTLPSSMRFCINLLYTYIRQNLNNLLRKHFPIGGMSNFS